MELLPVPLHVDSETADPFAVDAGACLLLVTSSDGASASKYDVLTGATDSVAAAWTVMNRHFIASNGTFFLGARIALEGPARRPKLPPVELDRYALFDGPSVYTHEPARALDDTYVVLVRADEGVLRTPFLAERAARRRLDALRGEYRERVLVRLAWSVFWHIHM